MAGTIISSPDLHELQRHNLRDRKDRISDLPDCILHHILSFLPTEEAVRTSILAKNWRYLWTYLPIFDFEIHHLRRHLLDQNHKSASCFFDLLDKLLHKSNSIERLHIKIHRIVDAYQVNSFISSALKHKLQNLGLFLDYKNKNDRFVLPLASSESLNKMCLKLGCTLYIPSGICFPSLKTLELKDITFANEKSAQQLFSGCPVLQELTLFHCYWNNIKEITIAISTLRMLTIHSYPNWLVYDHIPSCTCTIKIDAVNLLSLSCTINPIVNFVLVNSASMVDAYIDIMRNVYSQDEQDVAECVVEILSGLSSVKSQAIR